MSTLPRLCALGFALSLSACAVEEAPPTTSEDVSLGVAGDPAISAAWHYWRRLHFVAIPTRGGYLVRQINSATTPCWDGTSAAQCFVTGIDLSGTGLSKAQQVAVLGGISTTDWRQVTVILRGGIGPSWSPSFGTLVVDAAWQGGTGEPGFPTHGTQYYQVVDTVPSTVIRRPHVADADLSVFGIASPVALELFVTGLRDEELFDVDARFLRVH
jgi:hypothetical protein